MSTQAQIIANQANSQHSTGPKAERESYLVPKQFRHGFTGTLVVLG